MVVAQSLSRSRSRSPWGNCIGTIDGLPFSTFLSTMYVKATPSQADVKQRKIRVLCVYGSESGTAKRGIETLAKRWAAKQSSAFEVIGCKTGNELARSLGGEGTASAKNLEAVVQQCDVLLVATSSYGAGDPPSNYSEFIRVISHEASMKSDALTGLQHAVLGYGSTTYTTFQNIPRLTDKFLGDCGSRRLVQRVEIDEHDETDTKYKQFGEAVLAQLEALPAASTPPACEWSRPANTITLLEEEDDELGFPVIYFVAAGLAALVGYAWWYVAG